MFVGRREFKTSMSRRPCETNRIVQAQKLREEIVGGTKDLQHRCFDLRHLDHNVKAVLARRNAMSEFGSN